MSQPDYIVLGIYLIGVLILGSCFGRRQRTTRDYFLGGKGLPWWALCLSIVATETSTLTVIGAPAIAYTGNLTFLQLTFGYVIGRFVIAFLLIPYYFKGELFTAYELLSKIFGNRVRTFSSIIFMITRILADGVRLWATALVLFVVIPEIGGFWSIVIIAIVTMLYTWRGGMAAVVWTDVVQWMIYMIGGGIALVVLVQNIPGGWEQGIIIAQNAGKLRLIDLSFNFSSPYTLWVGVIGGGFLSMASHGTDHLMVQRLLGARSERDSRRALIASGFIVVGQFLLYLTIGVFLYAFYELFPPGEVIAKADAVFPTFIVNEFPPGLAGLIVAALFAAAMSTLSSSINSLSSSSVRDFYQPRSKLKHDDGYYLKVGRLMTIVWTVILIGVAVLAEGWGSVLEVGLTIASFTYGSLLGIFLLAILAPDVGERGGLIGMAGGLIVMVGIHLLTDLAWTWYVLVGTAATFVFGIIVSTLIKD